MEKEIIKKIKNDIQKSGHPVSLKVSFMLNKKGWYVKNAPTYFDSDIKKIKEIDLVAEKGYPLVKDSKSMLIIECKKSKDNPWVFFRQEKLNDNVFSLNIDMMDITEGAVYDWASKHIFKKHYYYKRPCWSYYFLAFTTPESKKSKQIFEAIEKVLSALIFYWEQRESLHSKYKLEKKIITFFHPVIVVDGKLFDVLVKENEMNINETKWISLLVEREIKEPLSVRLLRNQQYRKIVLSKPYLIDIVTLDYFETFLENFEKRIKK